MDALLLVVGALVLFLVGFLLWSGAWMPRADRDLADRVSRAYAAQAEIEDRDIDQMVEALNERRRRAGKPEIGDELARQLEPHLRDG